MKFYDKEIYVRDQKIKSALTVIIIFVLGFAAGCYTMYIDMQSTIVELESKLETIKITKEE